MHVIARLVVPPPFSVIVPVPATVNAPVLAMVIVAPDADEVSVPLLVNVLPLTFKVILPVDPTVVLALIPVAAEVVVVNPPEPWLMLIVPWFPNVKAYPDGGPIEIVLVPELLIVPM